MKIEVTQAEFTDILSALHDRAEDLSYRYGEAMVQLSAAEIEPLKVQEQSTVALIKNLNQQVDR